MHEVLVNPLGGLSLPRKSVVRLTDRPDLTLDVYRRLKTTMQQCNNATLHATHVVYTLINLRRLKFIPQINIECILASFYFYRQTH